MEIKLTPENDSRKYVGYDLYGHPYNSAYPPNKDKFGSTYDGYATIGEGVLLYDFVVMGYDVRFSYKGKTYHLLNDGKAYLSDSHFKVKGQEFDNPMELVERLQIEGEALLRILKDIDYAEPV